MVNGNRRRHPMGLVIPGRPCALVVLGTPYWATSK
jgi:hypothetical protein